MKALSLIGGIGSMLIGAKSQGFKIIGNIEWRSYYHTGTFEYNFPGAFMVKTIEEAPQELLKDIDLVMGHTECGSYSPLNNSGTYCKNSNKNNKKFEGDIPIFVEGIKKIKPKFFAMDNLPKSLKIYSKEKYEKELPEYDIHIEMVSNFNYGNIQKRRNRMFVIGSLKKLNYKFVPGEIQNKKLVMDVLNNISENCPNHKIPKDEDLARGWSCFHIGIKREGKPTIKELKNFMKNIKFKSNAIVKNKSGNDSERFGYQRIDPNYYSPVLFKEDSHYNFEGRPLTIRERARIQGCPDDFVFVPDCEYSDPNHVKLIKQTGKFMPCEFTTYLSNQIAKYIKEYS